MKSSNKTLLLLFLSFVFAGAVEGVAPLDAESSRAFALLHSLLIAILLFSWCGAHADENEIMPPCGAKLLVAFFTPIGIPYYLLAGFGLKNGAVKLLKSVLFYALCLASYSGLWYVQHLA